MLSFYILFLISLFLIHPHKLFSMHLGPGTASLACARLIVSFSPFTGSTYCFLNSAFTQGHSLSTTPTPPMELCLFDGTSNNIISEVILLPIKFSSSECMTLDFYITLLDSCCSLVLDHSWLIHYNPLADWVSGSITFQLLYLLQSPASVPPVETLVNPLFSPVENPLQFIPSEMSPSNPKQPQIAIINAPALLWALHYYAVQTFRQNK